MPVAKPPFPRLNRSHPLAQGLVGAWPLYEGGGTTVNDLSGQGNNASFNNAPAWTAGQSGSCLHFSGLASQYVDAGNPANLQVMGNCTVAGWVRRTANGTHGIFSQGNGATATNAILYIPGGGKTTFYWGNNTTLVTGTTVPPINGSEWDFCVGTRQGVPGNWTGSVYLNGSLDGQVTGITLNPGGGNYICRLGWTWTNNPLNGDLDNVLVWNRALSPAEIAALYADSFALFRSRRVVLKAAGSSVTPSILSVIPGRGGPAATPIGLIRV